MKMSTFSHADDDDNADDADDERAELKMKIEIIKVKIVHTMHNS